MVEGILLGAARDRAEAAERELVRLKGVIAAALFRIPRDDNTRELIKAAYARHAWPADLVEAAGELDRRTQPHRCVLGPKCPLNEAAETFRRYGLLPSEGESS